MTEAETLPVSPSATETNAKLTNDDFVEAAGLQRSEHSRKKSSVEKLLGKNSIIFFVWILNLNDQLLHYYFIHKAGFPLRRNAPRAAESLLFFTEFHQKRTLKSRINFNFSAAEHSANQSYCSLCVQRDQNNSRSVRIPSSGKPALIRLLSCLRHN